MAKGNKGGVMTSGLTTKSPKAVDASMKCKGGSVDSDTTRSATAPTPSTLGGRTA